MSETTTPADRYEKLIQSYYGGHHHRHRHRRHGRDGARATAYGHGGREGMRFRGAEIDKSADRLLGSYYGRHLHRHHPEAKPRVEVSFSVDDGETLERAAPAGEEYVVAAARDDAAVFEEYVVERPGFSSESSLSEAPPALAVDPQAEYQVDVANPLGLSKSADCTSQAPGGEAASSTPAKTEAQADPAPPPPASAPQWIAPPLPTREPNAPAPSDDDFMSDMQAILTRQKVYDPVTKKTVEPDKLAKGTAAGAQPGQGSAANNSQAIFDKIAQSMQYANKYDLGTVELENRFADFDRMSDLEQQAGTKKRSTSAPQKPASTDVATATAVDSQDFIQDMDAMAHRRGPQPSPMNAGDDPFAFVPPSPDASPDAAAPAPCGMVPGGAAPGAFPGMPPVQIPNIQIPNIQMPNIQMPGMPAAASLSASTSSDLTGAFVAGALQTLFGRAADINGYFANQGAGDFIDWFNRHLAGQGPWANRSIGTGAQVATNFQSIWDKIPEIFGSAQINLLQFVSLMSIFINEVGETLAPISEKVGIKGHPGLAYAFDSIAGFKASYNDGGSNWTAYRCFRDPDFIAAHGAKAQGAQLQNTSDAHWSGHEYPSGYPTEPNPALAGFIMEADFYKFRGRGLIQTTWRGAYQNLIRFIQAYKGTQQEILTRQGAWAGMSLDKAANVSSNADWDALFMNSDLEIPCVAISQHSAGAGHYLDLSGDVKELNGKGKGSIWRMGKSISGGDAYADLFRRRVVAICNLLGN